MHLFFWDFRPIWLAISISGSSFIPKAISAGQPKVAAKISNLLETRSHRSHLSGALVRNLSVFQQAGGEGEFAKVKLKRATPYQQPLPT
jgi:hypothetical protein